MQYCRYIALYNYKPHKADEIELVKGRYYTVAEKCQDGWFQGACLSSGRVGVFPGNYVQMVRLSAARKSSMASALLASRTTGAPILVTSAHAAVNRTHSFPKTSPHHRKPSRKNFDSPRLSGVAPTHTSQAMDNQVPAPVTATSCGQHVSSAAAVRAPLASTSSSTSPTSPLHVADVVCSASAQSPKLRRKSSKSARKRSKWPTETPKSPEHINEGASVTPAVSADKSSDAQQTSQQQNKPKVSSCSWSTCNTGCKSVS